MKEEILVLLLGITALALVTVHAYKEFTTPTKTKTQFWCQFQKKPSKRLTKETFSKEKLKKCLD